MREAASCSFAMTPPKPLTSAQIEQARAMLDKLYVLRAAGLKASAADMERKIQQLTGKKPAP